MKEQTLKIFQDSLTKHRDDLLNWLNTQSSHKNRCLVGTDFKEVLQVVSEFKDALGKIKNGEFGHCKSCDGKVEIERLEFDFTSEICLDCFSEDQKRDLERDLELASKVQRHLLPYGVPCLNGIDIAADVIQTRIVGGDYYDFFCYKSGAQGIIVADVMGKGLPASMLMSNFQASLRILGPEYENLGALASRLNELFLFNMKLISFITVFLAKIDPETATLEYCNAGHNPPLLWDNSTGLIKKLNPTGPAIGITCDPEYTYKTIQLNSGDFLLLYTDGLVEARNGNGEEFGEDRLAKYLIENRNKSPEDFLKELKTSVEDYSGKFQDDVTFLVLKVR